MESPWHLAAIGLLIDLTHCHLQGRHDYFVGGNMFLYYRWPETGEQKFRGPDFFFVKGVERERLRNYWAVWEENGRYPDFIMELLSPTTEREDRTTKKELYEQTFRTPEYFLYDPAKKRLGGWRIREGLYQPVVPDERGWLWSEQLQLWVGLWEGTHLEIQATWPRFCDPQGKLVMLEKESERQQKESERQQKESERRRADAAEAEVARLRAILAEKA